jgi:hypothetical protein
MKGRSMLRPYVIPQKRRVNMNTEEKPIEVRTDHRCLLGALTDRLCAEVARGVTGRPLATVARAQLDGLLRDGAFQRCCLPRYLSLAPERFEREIQLPVACDDTARLDTRVLLWPVGARDGQHPHCDGWAAFMAVRGDLTTDEVRAGATMPDRALVVGRPELLFPEQDVSHHIHNVGDDVGLTIHVFGA